jgi:hypothetical protein
MKNVMEVKLLCSVCEKETIHTITYKNNLIEHIVCDVCKNGITLDADKIKQSYGAEFAKRILTKPSRMSEEMQQDLRKFLLSMPARIMTKPYRVIKEYKKYYED